MNRRDLLKFAGGATVGALVTPAPWRLITDTAIWSENWPGIPRPARGPVSTRFTHCPLCRAGCALRARCVGSQPISLAGVEGGLCSFGVTAHHLPYQAARVRNGSADEAASAVAAAIRKCAGGDRVAVLDRRPGRTASWTFRRALSALPNGTYIAAAGGTVSVKLENARTVLSLGAPLLDGWCAPSRAFAVRDRIRIIQAEAVESRTAALADEWLPIAPGSEGALALALAGRMDIAEAANRTGLTVHRIEALAHELSENGPSLAIDERMSSNVVALNIELGGWGRTIFPRAESAVPGSWRSAVAPTALADVPDRSVRVLLIDESLPGDGPPWGAISPKLTPDAVVATFAFAPDGYAPHARFVIPAPVFPEMGGDVEAPLDLPAATFRPVAALVDAPSGMTEPAVFVAKLANIDTGATLQERAEAIHAAAVGTLVRYGDRSSVAVKDLSAADFWKALRDGCQWIGEESTAAAPSVEAEALLPGPAALTAVAVERALTGSPLLSKLYRESNLMLGRGRIAMHPADARAFGIAAHGRAMLETADGSRVVAVAIDAGVRRGVVAGTSAGPVKVVRI